MYKPAPLSLHRSRARQPASRRWAWAGNLLAVLLVILAVAAVEYGPDLLAGWIF